MDYKLLQIFKKTNGHCFYCGYFGENMEIDHFVPRSWWYREKIRLNYFFNDDISEDWDTENKVENLFLSCRKCNRKKYNKYPSDYFKNPYKIWKSYVNSNIRIGIFCRNWGVIEESERREKLGLKKISHLIGGNFSFIDDSILPDVDWNSIFSKSSPIKI